jgi:hypothetical protein
MTDDKKKAERHFNWQAIKESVERMKPEIDCSVVHSCSAPRRNL